MLVHSLLGLLLAWLAPVQVKILPISDKYTDYAYEIKRKMFDLGIRVEVDDRNEKIGYKIREAQVKKVPYSIIVGENELENKNISVRKRREKETVTMDTDTFINNLLEEIKTKAQ